MTIKFTNNAETLLSTSSLGTGDTSVAVDDGSVFPALSSGEFFYATLIRADALTTREIVKVTARSGNTLTIVRAQDNTSALTFSADDLIELRIVAATLESLKAADELTTGDAAVTLATSVGNITIDAQGNDTDIILKGTDGSSDTTFLTIDGSDAGKATFNSEIVSGAVITSGAGLVIANAGNIGSASDTDAIAIASNGVVTFSQIPVLPADTIDSAHYVDGSIDTAHIANSQITNALMADDAIDSAEIADGSIDTAHIADNQVTLAKMAGLARGKIIYGDASGDPAALTVGSANYVLTSDGTDISWAATTGADPSSADGDSLGTASAEWSDLYLADGGVIYFGNDQDTTLTHTDGIGLTLNSTNKLCFNDATQFIQGASGTVLDIAATDEIELTATLVDVNANLDVSGTYTGGGTMTTGGNIVIPDSGYIGSATTTAAIHVLSSGEVGIGSNAYTGAQLYSYDNGTGSIGLRVHLDNASSNQIGAYITTDGGGAAVTGHTNGAHYGLYGLSGVSGSSPSTGYYGVYGKTFHPTYGGVLGYNAAGDKYGILGYSTTHAFYGVGLVYSSGAATHSDIRLKDIQSRISVSDGILAKINQLQPTYFKWKPESEQGKGMSDEQIGLIAQEVELIFPHLVDENDVPQHDDLSGEDTREKTLNEELGSTKVVAYEKLACYLTSAIQELSAKNDALEARIATLESG